MQTEVCLNTHGSTEREKERERERKKERERGGDMKIKADCIGK